MSVPPPAVPRRRANLRLAAIVALSLAVVPVVHDLAWAVKGVYHGRAASAISQRFRDGCGTSGPYGTGCYQLLGNIRELRDKQAGAYDQMWAFGPVMERTDF